MGQAFTSISKKPVPLSPSPSPPLSTSTSTSLSILTYFSTPSKYSKFHRYSDSKFLISLFVREFAAYLPSSTSPPTSAEVKAKGKTEAGDPSSSSEIKAKILINSVCPGTVSTTADDNLPFWLRIPLNLNRRLRARTIEDGAAAVLNAALCHGEGSCGKYIANDRISGYFFLLFSFLSFSLRAIEAFEKKRREEGGR